eukprot:5647632-Prymnesium_polylepis.4
METVEQKHLSDPMRAWSRGHTVTLVLPAPTVQTAAASREPGHPQPWPGRPQPFGPWPGRPQPFGPQPLTPLQP